MKKPYRKSTARAPDSKAHTLYLEKLALSFEARSKYHRGTAKETFQWIIWTGIFGIILAIIVPPLSTWIDRQARPEVTTEALLKLKGKVEEVKTRLTETSANYEKEFVKTKAILREPGSYFVRASIKGMKDLEISTIEAKWNHSDGSQLVLARVAPNLVEDSEGKLTRFIVLKFVNGASEPIFVNEVNVGNGNVDDITLSEENVYALVEKRDLAFTDAPQDKEADQISLHVFSLESNSPSAKVISLVGVSGFSSTHIKPWGDGVLILVPKVGDDKPNSLLFFDRISSEVTEMATRVFGQGAIRTQLAVSGNQALMLATDAFQDEEDQLVVGDLFSKTFNKVQLPKAADGRKLNAVALHTSGSSTYLEFVETKADVDARFRIRTASFLAEFNYSESRIGELVALNGLQSSSFLRLTEVSKASNGTISVMGALVAGNNGIDRPVICKISEPGITCDEFRYNRTGLDAEPPEMSKVGARFLNSVGLGAELKDRHILVEGGLQEQRLFGRRNRMLTVAGNGQQLINQIAQKVQVLATKDATKVPDNSDEILTPYKIASYQAEIAENLRTKDAVFAKEKLAEAFGNLKPLYAAVREIEHLPASLPILEDTSSTAHEKGLKDSEIKELSAPGTQIQQIVTRLAVLAIFAYLLHLLVVRQRIQQVLEEHNVARHHALKMLAGQRNRPQDAAAEAKLLHELVTFADASLRIPPNPPAPPISKLADALKSAVGKTSGA